MGKSLCLLPHFPKLGVPFKGRLRVMEGYKEVSQITGTVSGVPIMRIIVFGSPLFWETTIYHLNLTPYMCAHHQPLGEEHGRVL